MDSASPAPSSRASATEGQEGGAVASRLQFLQGGGELGGMMRSHDWSASPLGPPSGWPQSLRSVVGLMLGSRFPMFVAWGGELAFLYNDAYSDILGTKHPWALGRPFEEVWSEIWADIRPLVDETLAGRAVFHEDLPLIMRRKGFDEQTWFTFSYSPLHDETGAICGIYCACTETTAQVLAERHRVAENERLRQLFREAPGFMCVLRGPTHVFELVNAAYSQLVGHRSIEGKAVLDALPEVKGQGFIDLLDQVYQTGESYIGRHMPIDMQHRPGAAPERRFVDFIYQPILDPAGQVSGIFVEGSDVTEAHRVQEELRESRDHLARETNRLKILNDVGTQIAAELNVDALVQHVVDAGVELTEAQFGAFFYNVQSATGERMLLYALAGADKSQFEHFGMPRPTHIFAPTFRGEGIIRSRDITADERYGKNAPHAGMPKGHLPVRSYLAVPVASRSGEVIGGLFFGHPEPDRFDERAEQVMTGLAAQAAIGIDNARLFQAVQRANENLEQSIEERTAELKEAHEALRQSQKMEAVGQLTGGIAHDFNNLLQGIVGSLDIVQKRISQGRTSELDRFVSGAMTSANRAAALTHRLLAFSRRQPLDPKPVKANPLIASMEDLLRRTMGEKIEIELVLAGGLWTTLCDQNQLESAILNLAINARDAMPDGGKLTIETCNAHLDTVYAAKLRDVTPGQYVCICVTDTGTGMTPDVIERAFDPFFTTKPIGQGTGLGLSMIYGFARQSEGYARIYSEVGQGTTVKLYLPRHRTEPVPDDDQPHLPEIQRAEDGEVVLVVEDDLIVRGLIVEVLTELGYQALEAADGPSGLNILQSDWRIDLLITDIGLPGLNGRQMTDAARAKRPGLKVLFMTGYAENAALANGFLEPGMEMITKPFAMEVLATRIRSMIESAGKT